MPATDQHRLTVLIVEDHRLVAESMAQALGAPDIDVVGIVGSVDEACAFLDRMRVSVVLLDLSLSDSDGVGSITPIVGHRWAPPVIVVSAQADRRTVADALDLGCAGFISKLESMRHLGDAIRGAVHGTRVLSPNVAALLTRSDARTAPAPSLLSERECEVMRLIAEGLSTEQIAGELFLSANTVRNHLGRINAKLGTHSRVEALAEAVSRGIIAPQRRQARSTPRG